MTTKKIFNFLTGPGGRKLTFHTICASSVLMFSAKYLPNTLFIEKYKEVIQAYRQGDPRPIPDYIQHRFDIATKICQCTDFELKFLKPFIAYGFDVLHIGTTKSRFKAFVGVPTNYFYEKIDDIDRINIQIRQKEINWNSPDGKQLQEALVLTEKEQIFGIARSILQLNTHKLLITSLYGPISLAFCYGISQFVNQRLNFYAKPFAFRLIVYTLVGLFSFGLYSFLTDFTQIQYDTSVDKKLCEFGPEFIAAGVSFYDKLLKKNVAIRNLIGEDLYTASGNDKYLIRTKSLPLTIRKSYFQLRLNELNQAAAEAASSNKLENSI